MDAAPNTWPLAAQLHDARFAWSITCLVLSFPLLFILWYIFKRRQPIIDRFKTWLASRPIEASSQRLLHRQLRELQLCLGPSWLTRARRSRHLQSALCLSPKASSLQQLLLASAYGFARRGGLYSQEEQSDLEAPSSFGWAKHDNFLLLGWADPDSSDPSKTQAWSTFLGLTARTWALRKVRYMVFCVEVQDLLDASPHDLQTQAQAWGQRLHLACIALGRQLPIYLVIQGLDSLPGFERYCARISHGIAQDPWGWTSPQASSIETQAQDLIQAHHRFSQELMTYVLAEGLHQDAVHSSKDLINFAQSLCALNTPLLDSLRALLEYRFANQPVPLRGVFFTGNWQGKAMFHQHLLGELTHACQAAPAATPKAQHRRTRSKQLAIAALGMALAATWALPWRAAQRNQEVQTQMQILLSELQSQPKDLVNEKAWVKSFTLDERIATVRAAKPWSHRFGMSQAKVLEYGSRSLFLSLSLRWGVLPMLLQDQARIRELGQSSQQLDPRQAQELRNRLFRYLLLTDPGSSRQPELSGAIADRLVQSLAGHWSKHHHFSSSGLAKKMANRFVTHLKMQPELRIIRDRALLGKARSKLGKADLLRNFANHAIEGHSRNHPPLELDGGIIPAAFTAPGWNNTLLPSFENYLADYLDDAWILGLEPATTAHLKRNAGPWLASTYANAFEQAWKQGLKARVAHLGMQDPKAKNQDLELRYADAFETIARDLRQHTQLRPLTRSGHDPVAGLANKFNALIRFGQASVPQNPPGKEGPGLALYLDLLRKLSVLQEQGNSTKPSEESLNALLLEAATISASQPKAWRAWFKETLSAPIQDAKQAARSQHRKGQSIAWCELSQRLHEELFDRYPFKANAAKDVSLTSLTELLHPAQGELWRFIETQQGAPLKFQGNQLLASHQPQASSLHPRLRRQLSSIWRLSKALFPQGAQQPHLSLLLRARATRDVTQLKFQSGDQHYSYPSKFPLELQWPPQGMSSQSRVLVKHPNGTFKLNKRGVWSLFRLLESGQSQASGEQNSFFVSWPLFENTSSKARLIIHVKDSSSPFFSYPHRPLLSLFRSRWLQSHPPLFEQQRKCQS